MAAASTITKEPAVVVEVPKNGLTKAGHRASCPTCGWTSFRYDNEATAQLCATTHDQTCLDRFTVLRGSLNQH